MKTFSLKEHLRPAFLAFRTYWPAIVTIQLAALAAVLSYYFFDTVADFFAHVAEFKANQGVVFAAVATVISGGIVPELLKRVFRPKGVTPPSAGELANQFAMWACIGVLVDRFYAFQGTLFGTGIDVATLLPKVIVDQLVFTPIVSLPLVVAFFMAYESRYRWDIFRKKISLSRVAERIFPIWMTCLSFWPVMLLVVYSLPQNLQFPLFLFANAAYSILMIFIARRQADEMQ